MLSFASEFPVKECEPAAFVDCVTAWLEGSPHTTLPKDQLLDLPASGRWELRSQSERVEALLSNRGQSSIAAFKHSMADAEIDWTTTVVFSRDDDGCWVSVRTSREAQRAQLGLPPAKKPFIVKTLLSTLGGGLDGEVHVSDTPHNLSLSDLGKATRLLNGDADNYLPIVYISRSFDDRILADPVPLARHLSGLEHVLVEPDREFSRALQDEVESRNAYGGRVGVYWPTGEYYRYAVEDYPTEFDARRLIGNRIRSALLHRRPLARCTWARAEAEVARDAFDALRSSGSGDVDEYIREFDAEITAKNKQLEEAEEEIRRLRAQQRPYLAAPKKSGVQLSTGGEQEFFDGEFLEVIIDSLNAAAGNAQSDSRRQHVLTVVAMSNPANEALRDRKERLKSILRQYQSMDKHTAKELEDLGFTISEEGKHHKLTYMGDDRYVFALPKSGSDHRGGLNAASDIGKRIF
jgi:hypothetical protein